MLYNYYGVVSCATLVLRTIRTKGGEEVCWEALMRCCIVHVIHPFCLLWFLPSRLLTCQRRSATTLQTPNTKREIYVAGKVEVMPYFWKDPNDMSWSWSLDKISRSRRFSNLAFCRFLPWFGLLSWTRARPTIHDTLKYAEIEENL